MGDSRIKLAGPKMTYYVTFSTYYVTCKITDEGETENMGVCTKERKGVTAAVLMATPCTNSLGGESGWQKRHT